MFDLVGKRVLVTGASSGLGATLAEGLAERGAIVGICARRPDRLAEVLERVQAHSPDSRSWTVDLGDIDGLDAFATQVVGDLGGLDLLVNNAGIPKRRWAWAHRVDEVADVLRIDLHSPIALTQALLPALDASGGSVVFIGSVVNGRRVLEAAAKTITPVILELGGKDPFIVCDDADLPQAAHAALAGCQHGGLHLAVAGQGGIGERTETVGQHVARSQHVDHRLVAWRRLVDMTHQRQSGHVGHLQGDDERVDA